ncbi:exocyst complex component 3-like isoform X2 [Narcine bancroftii]|uniref:exocyst complex component 3-like isoform X2 n=1 Tax=Narcine bancroftii TaxID=1343680 RepID=UPI0038311C42
MPLVKSNLPRLSPAKLHGGAVKLQKEIILGSRMGSGTNPFEENLRNELNPFAEDLEREKNPFVEEEDEEEGPNGTLLSGTGVTPTKGQEKHESLTKSLRRMWVKKGKSPTETKSLFKLWSPTEPSSPVKSSKKRNESWMEDEPTAPANGPVTEVAADLECTRKVSFLRRGKGKAETALEKSRAEAMAKAKDPLSVLEIHQLIQKRELVVADRHIIELDEECERLRKQNLEAAMKDSERKAKDVALLYEALENELGVIVSESLALPQGALHLGEMVRTIEQEEKADRVRADRGGVAPRELRRKWREAVKASASERLLPSKAVDSTSVTQCLRGLGEQTVADLILVRKNIIPSYPKEFEVFNVYVRIYHEAVSSCLLQLAQRDLGIEELYTFLEWCHCLYFREVMGHEQLTAHISKQHLVPLLPVDTVHTLEDKCVSMVKILSQHIEKSAAITEELGVRIALCSLDGLADVLQSFQMSAHELYGHLAEGSARMECLVPQTIAVVNCCPAFRDYVTRLIQKFSSDDEELKSKVMCTLDKVERGGIKLLMEKLFGELKPHFEKLLKKKWLQNSESFETIVSVIRERFNQFHKMNSPPYQTLVNDVHLRTITEYLRALLQRRLTCTSIEMRGRVAHRLREESCQLQVLFQGLDSTMSWLDPAIEHLAEIIRLKDVSSIQMEVGALVNIYPDISKSHISAMLDMRGDMSPSNQQAILEALQELSRQDDGTALPLNRTLFGDIEETGDMCCFGLSGRSGPGCLMRWLQTFR